MRRFTVLLVVMALLAVPVFGATYGNISVTVTDATGAVLPGVTVEATSPVQIGTRTVVTDSTGQAVLGGLTPGRYTVKASLAGFQDSTSVTTVEQNSTASVGIKLATEAVSESITVTAEAPMVDTSRTTVAEHVTLEEVEALPVGRDYKAYAQLVPGVNVVPNAGGSDTPIDPAGKGGNNYADRGIQGRFGKTGSRDNTYYIDGLNVTDMGNGRGTMTFNNEVILEQEIVTSGVPAEFVGGKGFVGNVVTKSGGNEFSGSVNYYLQTTGMYEGFKTSDQRLHAFQPDRKDAAATLGGPIVRDRAWFFLSGQIRETEDSYPLSPVASGTGGTGFYKQDRHNYFGKVTLKATEATTIIGQLFSDPREIEGVNNQAAQDQDLVPNWYYRIEDTPETVSASIQHVIGGSFVLDGRYGRFEEEYLQRPMFPELGLRNQIRFPASAGKRFFETDFGSASTLLDQIQQRDQADVAASYFLNAAGTHTIKGGLGWTKLQDETFSRFNGGASLTSLAPELSGINFGAARDANYFSSSEYNNVLNRIRAEPTSTAFTLADTNHDGTVSDEEFRALTFGSSANNPYGVNFLRIVNLEVGRNNVTAQTQTAFLQDDWHFGNYTLNAGVRMEDWEYVASDGSMILDMDPTFSPRLGFTWDIGGEGRQKVSAFYGRYFDPIRTDMVHFGGNISGTVNAEQVFIGNDWYTYRLRGSREFRDAGFAPNLKNPTQDEFALTYGINITPTWAFMAQGFHRKDDNLIEDYDPHVYWMLPGYACAASGCVGNEVPANLVLTPQQHGYPATGIAGPVNFFLGNMIGAKRRTNGLDLAVERRFQNNWTGSVQYSWRDAEGNTNSDANADLQGDFIELDPRQPWMYGKLPGSIDHQLKLYGMYRTPFNLEIGGLAYYSSGAHYTESDIFLPGQYDISVNHGILRANPNGVAQTGAETHPSYMNFDAKLRYLMQVRQFGVDLFLDVYNVFNNQDAIFVEQTHDTSVTRFNYGEERALLEPRRYQAGVRLRF